MSSHSIVNNYSNKYMFGLENLNIVSGLLSYTIFVEHIAWELV